MGATPPTMDDARTLGERLRLDILGAVDPARAVERHWASAGLDRRPVHLMAIGKAAVPMASAALGMMGRAPEPGTALVITTPTPLTPLPGVETLVADHPLPTERNLAASARVEAFARGIPPGQTVLVLLSGGGSALLCAPAPGLTLDDLRQATDALLRAGATIGELNAVRKHTERLKGGRLGVLLGAGADPGARRVICLVVSDVLGDRLDVISSGPLAPDPTTYADALEVLRRRGVLDRPSGGVAAVASHLRRGALGQIDETPKPGDASLSGVVTRVIAGNQHAALAARDALLRSGIARVMVVCGAEGEASDVGRALVVRAVGYAGEAPALRPAAVVLAGETTVRVGDAAGRGGRNQEMALAAAIALPESPPMMVMTLATDGIDGPTDAAGAIVTSDTRVMAQRRGIDLGAALARHDSHAALDALGCLVRTGATGTNVNDVAVAIAW